ncbi:MAG: hypothetical protein PARBB_02430 [Parabacteroides distasonis]
MNTKIVYILTSSEKDFYLEQTMISACSLKKHNPDCYAILVIDSRTNLQLQGSRHNIMQYFDELKVIDVPVEFNQIQSSRYIKTSLRNLIDGNYLFIDGDTVICDDLSEIDRFNEPIAAVLDCHLPISEHQHKKLICEWAEKAGWEIIGDKYYNSGVMYVSDTPVAHDFYKLWHDKWLENSNKGFPRDQPTMGLTNNAMSGLISEMPGQWNCQIFDNGIKYFGDAKIIHYFSSRGAISSASPFILANNEIMADIRKNDYFIPISLLSLICDHRNLLSSGITLIGKEDASFYYSSLAYYLKKIYKSHPNMYDKVEKIIAFIINILN